jgi:maltooligosyltrehalose synthase
VSLPPGNWTDTLTGEEIKGGQQPVTDVLSQMPVALLVR